ncbi:GntR family transcriptional regulator [Ulvibacterium marinum]|uniref:GntR family transcriptional regulator n=1 Tax=Ulvibacterium marinum TaxID=2419782 RepID=UPI002493E2E0|nr:GntR family transcriptional regulator [Ulvibacterium marinum]
MQKQIVRNLVKEHLLKKMREGKLKIGKTINLAAVARELQVSVTPIREALSQLQQAQIIKAVPNRGFVIAQLNREEAKDLYELVANLEEMALENSVFDENAIQGLKRQQQIFESTTDPLSKINADLEFHRLLTKNYPNVLTRNILHDLRTRIFFYEKALMSDESYYTKADNQHEAIISAIEENNVPTAALLLKMNWMLILNYIQKRLLAA